MSKVIKSIVILFSIPLVICFENKIESVRNTYANATATWNSYRIEMYRQVGVYEELKDLDLVLDRHLKVIHEIQNVSNLYELGSEERKTLSELHKKAFREMDEDVRSFVGDDEQVN